MGWSEPANIYFLSHDIQRVLYLVLLYGDVPLKVWVIVRGTILVSTVECEVVCVSIPAPSGEVIYSKPCLERM